MLRLLPSAAPGESGGHNRSYAVETYPKAYMDIYQGNLKEGY